MERIIDVNGFRKRGKEKEKQKQKHVKVEGYAMPIIQVNITKPKCIRF